MTRAILAALFVCLFAPLGFAEKPPKAILVLTYVMPRNQPDIRKQAIPENSEDACWEAAKAFTHKGVPEELKGIALGVMAGCLIPDHSADPDEEM